MGASGLTVKTQSLLSVLIGGIAFESPAGPAAPDLAPANAVFTLYSDRTAAFAKVETVVQHYVLLFAESLRGLSVGAPVTFMGMPVGEVTDVGLEFNPATFGLRPRVVVATYPDRFVAHFAKGAAPPATPRSPEQRHAFAQRLVDRGLRAQLQTGSLISGQLFVAFQYFPKASKARIDWAKDPPEFPVVPGGLAPFEEKILTILTKLEQLPLDDISRDLRKVLGNLDRMVVNVDGQVQELVPELKKTLGTLDLALRDVDKILVRADEEIVPTVKNTLQSLQATVESAQRVLANTDTTLLGPDAPAQQELRETMQELSRAARGIRLIADYFERHPESLIRGKSQEKP